MSVRAKFRCNSVTDFGHNKKYTFSAVIDDGTPENQRYHKYTPSGNLDITIDNPSVSFEVGNFYYLDFSPVETGMVSA